MTAEPANEFEQLMKFLDRMGGQDIWMVCRAGHLWRATVPMMWEIADLEPSRHTRQRVNKIRRCLLCKVFKDAGGRVRGITKVHGDWLGIITAKQLHNGTIEHHKPEQVKQLYSEERVKHWGAAQALIALGWRK